MRTIKFRAWHKEAKTMDYPNFLSLHNWIEEKQPIELMQFTGLLDKNSVEIYSGDIIKFMEYDGNGEYEKAEVNWYEYAWKAGTYFLHEICQIRVIGNVYQDKHLLDDKNN